MSPRPSTARSGYPGEVVADGGHDVAGRLREAMVRSLQEEKMVVSESVAAAFRTVFRHLFAPGEALEAAYDPHGTVVPKRDADGRDCNLNGVTPDK